MRASDDSRHSTPPSDDRGEIGDVRRHMGGAQPRSADDTDTASDPTGSPSPQSFSVPGYQIVREIHRGGQGVVYQAVQQSTSRKVAIKVIKEGPFAGPREQARFEREILILGQLNHPNIVDIYDSGTTSGNFYYVMDYISGQPLDENMAGEERSIKETLLLFAKICDAVNAAHLRGVIHRDLKPGNIRIDTEGQPHLLDFGLAKTIMGEITDAPRAQVMTVTGQFIGSLQWASPEQAEGIPSKIDMRTDVYSLGVILYHMLSGKFPYDVVGTMRDVLNNILTAEPTRPSTIRRKIDDEVETIVLKCLNKDRDRRYQTAGELARDIRHYLAGEPIEAKRDSGLYVVRKMIARYRTAVGIGAVFYLTGFGFGVVMVARYGEAVAELDKTTAELTETRNVPSVIAEGVRLAGGTHPRYDLAVEKFREAVQVNPRDIQALHNLAIGLKELYNRDPEHHRPAVIEEAIGYLDRILDITPDDARSWSIKGVMLKILERYPAATEAYQKALECNPENTAAWVNLGVITVLAGDLAKAEEHLKRATELATEPYVTLYAWRSLAALQLHRQDPAALESIDTAIKNNHLDAATWVLKARIRLAPLPTVNAPDALMHASQADKLTRDTEPKIERVLALAYLRNERYADAIIHAQVAITGKDIATINYLVLSIAEAHRENADAARRHLAAANDQWPDALRDEGSFVASADRGVLWFETGATLITLEDEAVTAIRECVERQAKQLRGNSAD